MSTTQVELQNIELMSEEELELRIKIASFVNEENAYKKFDEQVQKRVLGQKNLSEITYNVFMWLRGLAENRSIRNNAMIAAPSGCGKTETYRVIKEILGREISDIPVVQLDVTKLTSEGYKGMDSKDFFIDLFTDIQFLDSVELDKDKLLPMRGQYSDQLDSYLEQVKGMENRTCFIYFDEKKDKVEKTIKKMKEKYQKDGKSILRDLGADFKFSKAVEY